MCASGLAKVLRVRAADASWIRGICFGLAATAARVVDTWQWNVTEREHSAAKQIPSHLSGQAASPTVLQTPSQPEVDVNLEPR